MLTDRRIRRADLLARRGRLGALDDARPTARVVGEIDLDPEAYAGLPAASLREAAVLLPLVERGDGLHLILTRRTDTLRAHSGQVALPGGKVDAADGGSPVTAALREAEEEIGLDPGAVEPVGLLSPFVSSSGYRIHPLVGLIEGEPTLLANPGEVAEVFDVPLAFLMDPVNHRVEWRDFAGRRRYYYVMDHGGHHIWGVTAGILRLFYDEVFR
jgi:8-oxo-dGTP pyrophosphatase MutT (NUDIX family)